MRLIQIQSPLFSLHCSQNQQKQLKIPKLSIRFSSNEGGRLGTVETLMFRHLLKGRTKAVMHSTSGSSPIVLSFPSPAKSIDPATFLQISVLLLVLYWVSNFVVPDLISKYFQFDEVTENEKQSDDNGDDDV